MDKRIYELDVARIIVALTLPLIHMIEFWGNMYGFANMISSHATGILNPICDALCIFVAPTFMVCMGMNMSFTRKSTCRDFLKRGVVLLGVELALNIIRYEIPGLFALLVANSGEAKEFVVFSMHSGAVNSDILALAGLAFLVFGLLKKLGLKPGTILIISFVLYVVDYCINLTIMPGLSASMNFDVANLLGHLIHVDDDSTFPLMEWLTFISVGYCLGVVIKADDAKARKSFFNIVFFSSVVVFGLCLGYAVLYKDDPIAALNKSELHSAITPLCLVGDLSASLLFLSGVYKLYCLLGLIKHDAFNAWASRFSSSITAFYCVQWTLVGWGMMFGIALFLNSEKMPMWAVLISSMVICIISYCLGGWFHLKVKKKQRW